MAGETIFACRYAKHPTNAIAGVTHGRIVPSTQPRKDQGAAGSTGRADTIVPYRRVMVEVYGTNYAALLALVAAAKANVVFGTYGAAGAMEKVTIKNVYFFEPAGQIEVPARDGGGTLSVFGVRGVGLWATSDTFATMIVAAADGA